MCVFLFLMAIYWMRIWKLMLTECIFQIDTHSVNQKTLARYVFGHANVHDFITNLIGGEAILIMNREKRIARDITFNSMIPDYTYSGLVDRAKFVIQLNVLTKKVVFVIALASPDPSGGSLNGRVLLKKDINPFLEMFHRYQASGICNLFEINCDIFYTHTSNPAHCLNKFLEFVSQSSGFAYMAQVDTSEVYLYYTGHGSVFSGDWIMRYEPSQTFWGRLYKRITGRHIYMQETLSVHDLLERISKHKPATPITIVSDCCFSGKWINQVRHFPNLFRLSQTPIRIMASSGPYEIAYTNKFSNWLSDPALYNKKGKQHPMCIENPLFRNSIIEWPSRFGTVIHRD